MRYFIISAALFALAACDATVPDSGAGVGFGDYETYQKQKAAREAQLSGQVIPGAPAVSSVALDGSGAPQSGINPQNAGSDVALETQAVLAATRANSGEAPLDASPSNPAPVRLNNPAGISEENDFSAVDARRTIQDDAALRALQQAQYEEIQPTALPKRNGSSEPSIVEYALSTTHPRGARQYSRSSFNAQARYQKNCAKYPSPDLAQTEFLAKGGPQNDRLGLDPDGDGFACTWDPTPFRKARSG